jgi:predicted acetyltransferase
MYAGHIGYGIQEEYRGNHYAARACNLIKKVALDHGFSTLWITCNPENYPSRRTCEILACEFVEIVDLPEDTDMYKAGDRRKCRYRWDIG